MRTGRADGTDWREGILRRLGIQPTLAQLRRTALDVAIGRAEASRGGGRVDVLDAGCGRHSALAPYRARIGRFVGIDIHAPAAQALPYLDEFMVVDVCSEVTAFPEATFDVALSSFTVEHFDKPAAAFSNLRSWLRPGGTLVLTTVNRRHPFVAAYLDMPARIRNRTQPLVKASAADAHRLVGACNDPATMRDMLISAGFEDVRIVTIGNLARAWKRRVSTFLLGTVGDLLTNGIPSRRSTLVVTAHAGLIDRGATSAGHPGRSVPDPGTDVVPGAVPAPGTGRP